MLEFLRPKEYYPSVNSIDFFKLRSFGIKGILLDIDDTIIIRGKKEISPSTFVLIESLKEHFKLCIISNNFSPKRVQEVGEILGIPFVTWAAKPFPWGFKKASVLLGINFSQLAIIGDQLFMDIMGGNSLGIHTILVSPLSKEKNLLRIAMRWAEDHVLESLGLK
jgi:HAD superfamily phosphatase (TIGR01668 family)